MERIEGWSIVSRFVKKKKKKKNGIRGEIYFVFPCSKRISGQGQEKFLENSKKIKIRKKTKS
jgi:hypothetical protein